MSKALNATYEVLKKAGEPLHYKEITKRALDQGLWHTDGKTPEATVNAQLATEIKKCGAKSRFRRTGKGIFALKEWADKDVKQPKAARRLAGKTTQPVSFTDAAAQVVEASGKREPMHYREITKQATKLGLIKSSGKTPEATMYASIFEEIQRYQKRGEQPRFHMHGRGLVGLAKWQPVGIPSQIESHNKKVRKQLHQRLKEMTPGEFEELVGLLLSALGFEDVEVTKLHSDGGIDVRGTLVVGGAIRTKMAVQAKRWGNNVQAPTVQQVRGSLGAHEQGLIITTSDFGNGARQEAERLDAVPVGLMNGDQLISLLIEHEIGVRRQAYDLIELTEEDAE